MYHNCPRVSIVWYPISSYSSPFPMNGVDAASQNILKALWNSGLLLITVKKQSLFHDNKHRNGSGNLAPESRSISCKWDIYTYQQASGGVLGTNNPIPGVTG